MKKNLHFIPYTFIIHFFLCLCILYLFSAHLYVTAAEEDNPPEVNSLSVVMIDADSGIVIYEKNRNEKLYPASITKIMTALLATEHFTDYDMRINFSHNAVFSIQPGSSHIAMDEGETLSADEALYGLMLASANEVANALAEDIGGSIEDFAALMTARAGELGAVNTSFMNPHGLHDENHYTTAYDMSLIMKEAVKNPKFVEFISTLSHDIPPTEKQPLPRPLYNTNKMIVPVSDFFNEDVIGGKTGYTDEARHTLVTYASRGGINLIVAVLHGEKNEPYIDTAGLLNYGFDLYGDTTVINAADFQETVEVFDSTGKSIGTAVLKARESKKNFLPSNIVPNITQSIELDEGLTENSIEGSRVGMLKAVYGGIVLGETELFIEKTDFVKPIPADGMTEPESEPEDDVQSEQITEATKVLPEHNSFIQALIIFLILTLFIAALLVNRYKRFKRYRRYSKPLRFVSTGRLNRFGRFK